jgi:hypothetical protein
MAELAQAGCVAFSNDGVPVANNEIFRRAVEYASDLGLKVIDHCEEPGLANGGVMNEGAVSAKLGLKGQPTTAEASRWPGTSSRRLSRPADPPGAHQLPRIGRADRLGQAQIHPGDRGDLPALPALGRNPGRGLQHLAKVNPPLRTRDDVLAVRQALRTGVLDILVTDHAPHADFEKEVPFDQAPNGISGWTRRSPSPGRWSGARSSPRRTCCGRGATARPGSSGWTRTVSPRGTGPTSCSSTPPRHGRFPRCACAPRARTPSASERPCGEGQIALS